MYAGQCLTSSFHDSGLALQDIVNQAGRRLGFKVEDGRYRGTAGEVGFDGIWRTAEGDAILAEVKTTDVYRLSLETTATYRRDLIKKGALPEESSSILYVVGRSGTASMRRKKSSLMKSRRMRRMRERDPARSLHLCRYNFAMRV
jgi:hypothetical protein